LIRAGIFIGVDRTGTLQRLHDAAAGAKRMHDWALGQGMVDQRQAVLITDSDGKAVEPRDIFKAIKAIVDGPGADQLIVYFAGHGVNLNRHEQWLLTDAPEDASAAVDVAVSVEFARYCGIQHVLFVSDACRVAPSGIQAQSVRGVPIVPNIDGSDRVKPVDQLFACVLGKTAAEIADPAQAAAGYSALYTGALLDALTGKHPELLEASGDPADPARYVWPRQLEKHLEAEIPRRVKALNLTHKVNQSPDAIITSDAHWIARVDPAAVAAGATEAAATRTRGLRATRGSLPEAPVESAPATLQTMADALVRAAIEGVPITERTRSADAALPASALTDAVGSLATDFGPDHFESECGIKIRGARIVRFVAPRAQAEILGSNGDILRVNRVDGPAASVLLTFAGDVGTVVPVLPGFIAALSFTDGDLVDVAYEPSANTGRWSMFRQHAAELRALRAAASASAQHGRFRLDAADARKTAQKMQYAKGIDPSLAVYAAYAYHDLQMIDRIRAMSGYLQSDIGVTLFDVALLARQLLGRGVGADDRIVPFVPLLAQGWALLRANGVKLHPALERLESRLQDSLWSLYDGEGVRQLEQALQSGAVR
jgi:hypothetical protein